MVRDLVVLACSRTISSLLWSSLRWFQRTSSCGSLPSGPGGLALSGKVIINSGKDLLSSSFEGWIKSYHKFQQLLQQSPRSRLILDWVEAVEVVTSRRDVPVIVEIEGRRS